MKKEVQQALLIGAVVILVLAAIGIAWRSLAGGNPAREKLPASAIKPDPLPEGTGPVRAKPPVRRGE